jgi:hypothetical protein
MRARLNLNRPDEPEKSARKWDFSGCYPVWSPHSAGSNLRSFVISREASRVIARCTCGEISDLSGTPMKKETMQFEHSISFFKHLSQSMIMSLTIEIGTDIIRARVYRRIVGHERHSNDCCRHRWLYRN